MGLVSVSVNGADPFSILLEFERLSKEAEAHLPQADCTGWCDYCSALTTFEFLARDGWNNYRNNFVCRGCGLSARQRHFYKVVRDLVPASAPVLIAEQVTPFYAKFRREYPNAIGCEYLGPNMQPGMPGGEGRNANVRHEDLRGLSFQNGQFDAVVHQDVLEHVDGVDIALSEAMRVLKPGGWLIFSTPFFHHEANSILCARGEGENLVHLLPPSYHGNPLSSEGALVYEIFGLDLLARASDVGFREIRVDLGPCMLRRIYSDANPYKERLCLAIIFVLQKP